MTVDPDSAAMLFELIGRKAPAYLDLLTAASDEEFEAAFTVLLEGAVQHLEKNKKNFEKLDEEGLSAVFAGILGDALRSVLSLTVDPMLPLRLQQVQFGEFVPAEQRDFQGFGEGEALFVHGAGRCPCAAVNPWGELVRSWICGFQSSCRPGTTALLQLSRLSRPPLKG